MSRSHKKYAGGKYCGNSDKPWKEDFHRKERSVVRDALKSLEKDPDNDKIENRIPAKKQEVDDIYSAPSDGGSSFWWKSKDDFEHYYKSLIYMYGKNKGDRRYSDEEIDEMWLDTIGK